MLSQGVQRRHERVALLSAFSLSLPHLVRDSCIVCPEVRRRLAVGEQDEWGHGGGLRQREELLDHAVAAH
eukprot:3635334-Pyramimonas_sp.AAC.1